MDWYPFYMISHHLYTLILNEGMKKDAQFVPVEIERRKAQYLPIIRKYWEQFQEVIPRLTFSDERKVYTSFLFISHEANKQIKWFIDYCSNDIKYGFDAKGRFYRRGDYSCYPMKCKSIENIIFDMLPWHQYSTEILNSIYTRRMLSCSL